MQKTQIHPKLFQDLFDSAKNAADKGQAQWFTPPDWGRVLCLPLPKYRHVVADLSCGNAQLLKASGGKHWLGCDIDGTARPGRMNHFISADITKFYPLLCDVGWEADLFVLNPPWDLHWYRENLDEWLPNSDCFAVQAAYLEEDPRLSKDTIDSTVATMMMALDRMSKFGEGMLIANEATLERLIFAADAPHRILAKHVWAHMIIEGNICEPTKKPGWGEMRTGVIWFARDHDSGPLAPTTLVETLANAEQFCILLQTQRNKWKLAVEALEHANCHTSVEVSINCWDAAMDEWQRLHPAATSPPRWHVWIENGFIRTRISLYETFSGRVTNDEAKKLYELQDKEPMKLVVMRESRKALEAAVCGGRWRVAPELQEAVKLAIHQFNTERAPLYRLPPIQRLGFLDEHDTITCTKDFGDFKKGGVYRLRSTTVLVKRQAIKINCLGLAEDVQLDGSELAFFIRDSTGKERVFMEGRLRDPSVSVNVIKPGVRELAKRITEFDLEPCAIDHTLHELLAHFIIPEVPDVAELFPAEYQTNVEAIKQIQQLVNL